MQNSLKKKIFIILFFFISTIPLNSSEQFNFNVTEIKITEDGNKFRGEKGGVVTTDDGIIINAGGFTHTSVALRDAIASVDTPAIEVHISNILSREDFRKKSFLSDVCTGIISGLGLIGYEAAIKYFIEKND